MAKQPIKKITNKKKEKPAKEKKVKVPKEPKVKKEKKSKVDSLFSDILKVAGNTWAGRASDGIEAGDISGFLDAGSLSLNALVSGKLEDGGFPDNKITV